MLSVNLPDSELLPNDEFFLKDWSENEDLAKELIKRNIIIPTGRQSFDSFVMAKSYKVSPEYMGSVEEGWGKNLAAGAMMGAASLMPMNAQTQQGADKDNTKKMEIKADRNANKIQKKYQSYELAMKEYAQAKKQNPHYDSKNQIYNELLQWKKQLDDAYKTYKFDNTSQINEVNDTPDPNYTHYAVLKSNNKIINGWDYNGYDSEDLKQYKKDYFFNDIADMGIDTKQVAIYTKRSLEQRGINPSDWNNWAKADETPFIGI